MRYDTPIFFQHIVRGDYNVKTGNYDDEAIPEDKVYASVMDTKSEMIMQIYGKLRQGSLTVHIQNSYNYSFDFIRIGSKRYKVDYRRKLRVKETFILSEVQ